MRRAQITIFIVLAFVILIMGGLVFFISKQSQLTPLEKEINKVYADFLSSTGIKDYTTACLDRAAKDAITLAALQGGKIYDYQVPEGYPLTSSNEIVPFDYNGVIYNISYGIKAPAITLPNYPYDGPLVEDPFTEKDSVNTSVFALMGGDPNHRYSLTALCNHYGPNTREIAGAPQTCETSILTNITIQEYLKLFILNKTEECINFPQITSQTQYNISKGEITGFVLMGNNDVFVSVTYPIIISVGGMPPTTKFMEFTSRPKVRLKKIHELATHLIGSFFRGNIPKADANNIFFNITKDDTYDCISDEDSQNEPCILDGMEVHRIKDYYLNNLIYDDLNYHYHNYSDILNITDKRSIIDGKPLTFLFAIENRAPVLDYINWKVNSSFFYYWYLYNDYSGTNLTKLYNKAEPNPDTLTSPYKDLPYDIIVNDTETIEIIALGLDPDEDFLNYTLNDTANYEKIAFNRFIQNKTNLSSGEYTLILNVSDNGGLYDYQEISLFIQNTAPFLHNIDWKDTSDLAYFDYIFSETGETIPYLYNKAEDEPDPTTSMYKDPPYDIYHIVVNDTKEIKIYPLGNDSNGDPLKYTINDSHFNGYEDSPPFWIAAEILAPHPDVNEDIEVHIIINVSDDKGLYDYQLVKIFIKDTNPPTVEYLNLSDGTPLSDVTLIKDEIIKITFSEDLSVRPTIKKIEIDDTETFPGVDDCGGDGDEKTFCFNYEILDIPDGYEGSKDITISDATDQSGNIMEEDTYTIDIDTIPPIVTPPIDPVEYNSPGLQKTTITFNEDIQLDPPPLVSFDGGNPGVYDCDDIDEKTFCFDYIVPNNRYESKTIEISDAKDIPGNIMELTYSTTLLVNTDTTPPTITIDTSPPYDFLHTNDQTPTLTGTINDGAATISVMIVKEGGGTITTIATNNGNTWSKTLPLLPEGEHDVSVTATDPATNEGTDTIDLIIDISDPEEVGVDGKTTSDPTPGLTGTFVDEYDEYATIEVTVNGNTYSATNKGGGTWALDDNTIPPLDPGTYDVSVTVTDLAGNSGTDTTTDELEITQP